MDATVCAGGAENLHRVAARRPSPTRPTRPIRRPARNPRPAPNGSPPGDLGTGSIGLAEDRTAAAEEHLLAGHTTRLRYLAMDLSAPLPLRRAHRPDPHCRRLPPSQARQQENRRGIPSGGWATAPMHPTKRITAPQNSSPATPAVSPTPAIRPAASAWPPPAPPARPRQRRHRRSREVARSP